MVKKSTHLVLVLIKNFQPFTCIAGSAHQCQQLTESSPLTPRNLRISLSLLRHHGCCCFLSAWSGFLGDKCLQTISSLCHFSRSEKSTILAVTSRQDIIYRYHVGHFSETLAFFCSIVSIDQRTGKGYEELVLKRCQLLDVSSIQLSSWLRKKKKNDRIPKQKNAIRLTSVVTLVDIHSNDQQLEESELWESDDGEEVRSPQLKQILNSESQKQRGENLRTFNQQTQGSLAYRSQPSRVCI